MLAGVYGPTQAQPRRENAEKAIVEVTFRSCSGSPGEMEREYEYIIRQVLEGLIMVQLHPRTAISIVLQVLQSNGSILSVALNAACAALVDAGIPLKTMFATVTVAVCSTGELLLDPNASEEQAAAALAHVTYPHRRVLALNNGGSASMDGGAAALHQPQHNSAAVQQRIDVGEAVMSCHVHGKLSAGMLMDVLEVSRMACESAAPFSYLAIACSLEEPNRPSGA